MEESFSWKKEMEYKWSRLSDEDRRNLEYVFGNFPKWQIDEFYKIYERQEEE